MCVIYVCCVFESEISLYVCVYVYVLVGNCKVSMECVCSYLYTVYVCVWMYHMCLTCQYILDFFKLFLKIMCVCVCVFSVSYSDKIHPLHMSRSWSPTSSECI